MWFQKCIKGSYPSLQPNYFTLYPRDSLKTHKPIVRWIKFAIS